MPWAVVGAPSWVSVYLILTPTAVIPPEKGGDQGSPRVSRRPRSRRRRGAGLLPSRGPGAPAPPHSTALWGHQDTAGAGLGPEPQGPSRPVACAHLRSCGFYVHLNLVTCYLKTFKVCYSKLQHFEGHQLVSFYSNYLTHRNLSVCQNFSSCCVCVVSRWSSRQRDRFQLPERSKSLRLTFSEKEVVPAGEDKWF